jgi:hypothetical protein
MRVPGTTTGPPFQHKTRQHAPAAVHQLSRSAASEQPLWQLMCLPRLCPQPFRTLDRIPPVNKVSTPYAYQGSQFAAGEVHGSRRDEYPGVYDDGHHVAVRPRTAPADDASLENAPILREVISVTNVARIIPLQGLASRIMLSGVSMARRTLWNPPWAITSRNLASPACAPRAAPTSCDIDVGKQIMVEPA